MHSPSRRSALRRLGPYRKDLYERPYACAPDSVPRAREHLRQAGEQAQLGEDLIEIAALVLSELATNAVRHAKDVRERPSFTVSVCVVGRRLRSLRLEVYDHDAANVPAFPDPKDAPELLYSIDPIEDGGRGLALVATSADRVGVTPRGRDGKTVWCEVRLPEQASWSCRAVPSRAEDSA
ncbi:ATP-binding protein [Streptomyces sp. cg35]|uniref:ATP-binding protein n=1 Tax=Streptomyces sp. cg35 TaxID=3421650 RepID=UPI003D186C1B